MIRIEKTKAIRMTISFIRVTNIIIAALLAGLSFNNIQNCGLVNGDTFASFWRRVVDENGCIEGEECDDVIHLDEKTELNYNIGDQWIYEEEEYFGGNNNAVGYAEYFIKDTVIDDTFIKYALESQDTFYVGHNKMYFWDEYNGEYILYYDFDAITSYEIKYYDPFRESEEVATVIIDSISYLHFGSDSLKVQHVHILNSGTLEEYQEVVYDGIGAGHFGVKFQLGCGLCDFNPYITKLRCFRNEKTIYNFVDYACDSIWITTNTKEISNDGIKIYPNPTEGTVNIVGLNMEVLYEIYSFDGKILRKGKTNNHSLVIDESGFFIIRLFLNNVWYSKKIVNIK